MPTRSDGRLPLDPLPQFQRPLRHALRQMCVYGTAVGKNYQKELQVLDDTYRAASVAASPKWLRALDAVAHLPLIAIGSGGSFSAAVLMAQLHRRATGCLSAPWTPLEASVEGIPRSSAVAVISARGRNKDILRALEAAHSGEAREIIVVTNDEESPLAKRATELAYPFILKVPGFSGKDGYLATNSLASTITAIARAYSDYSNSPLSFPDCISLPARIDAAEAEHQEFSVIANRPYLLVLHGGWATPAGFDLESRMHESGIAAVQLADYRNFAHGRHQWLVRHSAETGVVALVTPGLEGLARATLDKIPTSIPRVVLKSSDESCVGAIELVAASMHLAGQLGFAKGIDPGRPHVPDWCRQLYGAAPANPSRRDILVQIERRSGVGISSTAQTDAVKRYQLFIDGLWERRIKGIVLDFDGTVVETNRRWDPISPEISRELSRLAEGGLPIAIASGRGKSVRVSLREALPKEKWPMVLVGYYNGTQMGLLSEDYVPNGTPEVQNPHLAQLADLLSAELPFALLEKRIDQLTIAPAEGMSLEHVWRITEGLIRSESLQLKSLKSGHSVDVVPQAASKALVMSALADKVGCSNDEILRIGDRAAWPGNDYEIVPHPLGLSVDEPSLYGLGGWNASPRGVRGPAALLQVLSRLERREEGWQLDLRRGVHERRVG